MALIRTGGGSQSEPTYTTLSKGNETPITGLTVGKKYILAFNAGNSAATLTGADIEYQEITTNASGSYYVHLIVCEATATSLTISASGLANPHLVAEIG